MNINNIGNMNNINNLINIDKPANLPGVEGIKGTEEDKPSFEEYLTNSIKDVNELQIDADRQSTLLATGQAENVHDVTIAATKAKISLDLTMAVRNKVVESYKEIMRMQV